MDASEEVSNPRSVGYVTCRDVRDVTVTYLGRDRDISSPGT